MKRLAPAAALALAGGDAQAHLVSTGFGAFYDGAAHVLVTPADLLVVVAVALLAGQGGPRAARGVVLVLPLAWLAGGIAGAVTVGLAPPPLWTTASFLAVGALVALDVRLRDAAVVAIALTAGVLHGLANGATMAPQGASMLAIAGALAAVACLSTIVAAEVTTLRAGWTRIAVRVGGSWIAASGVLMLGWLARA